ncbi:hypothetical protein J4457_02010 [Candidatus Woesearchaeota archaeon]|nr:hypothetical protein [Candidatus Woesearchaeota archaeon]
MKWLKPGKDNKEERENFIDYWVGYMKTHSDKEWGKQQNILINSQLQSARCVTLSREQYLALKKEL